ncbi:MAG: aminotransferase class I/II-fold pyridoxal phosphate-dependent enzyme [Actinomycetaceae bacterium]|nr:aminotransferase class I/II-fold pyridoxal phosphate-dependent enzyme [Arcanobacterium sp.]MDD7504794.1 aminotransferase class I/II-fold pyridoxal phosphate-dependent enzyme [Actinomycetaceae bacterium]MDY6142677.1 aminotransferase class I/II-fold pyridoxal phosphate-dependent enzyme [Arcanobacterium sp.]
MAESNHAYAHARERSCAMPEPALDRGASRFVSRRWASSETFSLDVFARNKYDDVIDLSIGDADFTTDQAIIDAAFADASAGHTHYGAPSGDPELVTAIEHYWHEDFGIDVPASDILVTASSAMGMAQTLLAIVDPGDEVIVFSPHFPVYAIQIRAAGGVVVDVPLRESDGFAINEAQLAGAITDRTKAIIFNNPTNPTGVTHKMASYEAIANVARAHDLLVIADEIYTDYIFDGAEPFVPMRALEGMAERTITLNSFSKNYMMAGWRIGYVVADSQLAEAIGAVGDAFVYTAPSVSQRAAIAAIEHRHEIRSRYIRQFGKRLDYVARRLQSIAWMDLVVPHGTFYLFPSIKRTGLTGREFVNYALDEAHVLVAAGEQFGTSGAGHVRIACTVPEAQLKEACDRLERLHI